jgi:hypothetical protein
MKKRDERYLDPYLLPLSCTFWPYNRFHTIGFDLFSSFSPPGTRSANGNVTARYSRRRKRERDIESLGVGAFHFLFNGWNLDTDDSPFRISFLGRRGSFPPPPSTPGEFPYPPIDFTVLILPFLFHTLPCALRLRLVCFTPCRALYVSVWSVSHPAVRSTSPSDLFHTLQRALNVIIPFPPLGVN